MAATRASGPDPDEITTWITTAHPDTVLASEMGATFFSLDESHWPNFATIVTTDEHDMGSPSNLSARPDVFRSVVMMSAPFGGPPPLPFNTVNGAPAAP